MKARGAVANVAAVRLKRLQHKQRRKVDFLAREKWRSNQQETQTATTVGVVHSKNMRTSEHGEDQRGALERTRA